MSKWKQEKNTSKSGVQRSLWGTLLKYLYFELYLCISQENAVLFIAVLLYDYESTIL